MYHKIIHRRYQFKRLFFLLALASVLFGLTWLLRKYARDFFSRAKNYDALIEEAASRHCVDPCLVKAVIWKESNFNCYARGGKGEVGMMQVLPNAAAADWAKEHKIALPLTGALFNPRLNLEIGVWYLAGRLKKWKKYKNCYEELALAEYNAGNVVKKWVPADVNGSVIDRITYPSTKNYVSSIMNKYETYSVRREAK
jgi:soluble lytic murein transglycosylase